MCTVKLWLPNVKRDGKKYPHIWKWHYPKSLLPNILPILTFILRLHHYKTIKPIHISALSKAVSLNYPRFFSITSYMRYSYNKSGELKSSNPKQFLSSPFWLNFLKGIILSLSLWSCRRFQEAHYKYSLGVPNRERNWQKVVTLSHHLDHRLSPMSLQAIS